MHLTGVRKNILRQQMDWEVEVVARLDRWRIGNGFSWFMPEPPGAGLVEDGARSVTFPFAQDGGRILRQYHLIRFYASLSPAARVTLSEGRLPLGALTPAQRKTAAFLLSPLQALSAGQRPEPDPPMLGLQPFQRMSYTIVGRQAGNAVFLPDVRLVYTPVKRQAAAGDGSN